MGRRQRDGDEPGEEFAHDDPVVDAALTWFTRLNNAAPDARVQAEFQAWLAQSSRHVAEFRALEQMWGSPAFGKAAGSLASANRGGQRIAAGGRTGTISPARRWRGYGALAAAAAVVMIGAWQLPSLLLQIRSDYLTSTGERATIALPDGSVMTLNTATAVAIDFEQGRRQVQLLAGEAFFDVKHDPAHPFRVAGQFGNVEVKGTAFAVRQDREEDVVVLERGLVVVSKGTQRTELHPGQMVAATANSLSAVSDVDLDGALAWRDGRIIFADQPLSRVLAELGRYHSGRVIVATGSVQEQRVTGNYRLDDIDGAFNTLADAVGVSIYRLPGGLIIFR
ncbi:FecR domain-containing protein [Hyphomicrobium sp. D-2]|uniref:FecR family protein n=1 Tax=Hyphomicrobium sp. D-2 TaxID=3041621 RepID=UPI0024563402|nr:FecR domain-containing protein [Hyphomicrobium sp. D-2]MDH4983707.1 FecR domain-containing protein [Hyphomicrobium sp. D-2]